MVLILPSILLSNVLDTKSIAYECKSKKADDSTSIFYHIKENRFVQIFHLNLKKIN